MNIEWRYPNHNIELCNEEAHVWKINLDDDRLAEELWAYLSEQEKHKANQYRFPQHRRCYIISHGALRLILSLYVAVCPRKFDFVTNEYGKPRLDLELDTNLYFNLSHSQNMALVAVCDRELGVDVEGLRTSIGYEDIAKRFFSSFEVEQLVSIEAEMRQDAFFSCWTRKEAYIKAVGKGLALPLDSFDVTLTSDTQVVIYSREPQHQNRWHLYNIPMGDVNYKAALVTEGQIKWIKCWKWQWDYFCKLPFLAR